MLRRSAFALLVVIACSNAVTSDPGTDALMQVRNAQFRRGAMPSESGGPLVQNASISSTVAPGRNDLGGTGELGRSATGLAVGLDGDVGYWTVPAAMPDVNAPLNPTFGFAFGVAATLTPGAHTVTFRAVDGDGHFGPAKLQPLVILGRAMPTGRLVVSLTWDSQVDLDLHVLLPNGVEIFKRNPAEYVPPPISAGPDDPVALHDGGVLDHDSNAHCITDGQRAEDAIWQNPPPRGHYIVRVDTFSMCGGSSANWRVEAVLDGQSLGGASGVATDNDLRFDHGRGGGVLAFEFDVP